MTEPSGLEEWENLLESLYWGDLEYLVGWLIETGEEGMGFLKDGPLWTKDDEYVAEVERLLDDSQPFAIGPIKFDPEGVGKLDTTVKLDPPVERVVIVSASVLDPDTDHCISISVQVSEIPKGLTDKEALSWALKELALQEIS